MILDAPTTGQLLDLPVDQLHPADENPRQDLGDFDELAASINAVGIIEPLIVTGPNGPHGYTIVAGHRRHAAAAAAGLDTVPCIVRSFDTSAQRIEMSVIENLQRRDLDPLEEARGFQMLVDLGMTQRQIADRVGCNQSHVSRRLKLGELDDDTRQQLRNGKITVRAAEQSAEPDDDSKSVDDGDRIQRLAEAMAQEPRIAKGGRSLDWAGYRIRLEARHGDENVPMVVETIAKVLSNEALAFKRSLARQARSDELLPPGPDTTIEDLDVEPDFTLVIAGGEITQPDADALESRDAVLIDIDERNIDLTRRRLTAGQRNGAA